LKDYQINQRVCPIQDIIVKDYENSINNLFHNTDVERVKRYGRILGDRERILLQKTMG